MSQNIAKFMANIISQLDGDFQQGGCLFKSTSGSQWTPVHLWMSDRPHKQALAKADLAVVLATVVWEKLAVKIFSSVVWHNEN